MENAQNNGVAGPAIPNPPGGGSWKWDAAQSQWVSLDPQPVPAGGETQPRAEE